LIDGVRATLGGVVHRKTRVAGAFTA